VITGGSPIAELLASVLFFRWLFKRSEVEKGQKKRDHFSDEELENEENNRQENRRQREWNMAE